MTTRMLLAGAASLLIATPALATHCPMDAAAIDQGLAKLEVSDEVRSEVQTLRDRGMEEHEAGDHGAAEDTLAEAMRMLLENAE